MRTIRSKDLQGHGKDGKVFTIPRPINRLPENFKVTKVLFRSGVGKGAGGKFRVICTPDSPREVTQDDLLVAF